jgi:hypothetical protein
MFVQLLPQKLGTLEFEQMQLPLEHVLPVLVQLFAQLPQLLLSVFRLIHVPLQFVVPLAQQTPFELTSPLAQQRPEEQLPLVHWMLFVQVPVPLGEQLPPLQ